MVEDVLSRNIAYLLRPSRHLYTTAAIVLGWRSAGWFLRGVPTGGETDWPSAIAGVAADGCLVVGYFVLARGAGLLLPGRTKGSRTVAATLRAVLAGCGSLIPGTRALDAGHCYLTGRHFAGDSFAYLDARYLLAQEVQWALLGAAVITGLVVAVAVLFDSRRRPPGSLRAQPMHEAVLGLLAGLAPTALLVVSLSAAPPTPDDWHVVPELNLVRQAWRWHRAGRPSGKLVPPLAADLREALGRAGLAPDRTVNALYPLTRRQFDRAPFPYPQRAGRVAHTPQSRPNVVITFAESLNTDLVFSLSRKFPGLMPATSALVRSLTSVSRYTGTTSPTSLALVAGLCGVHLPVHPTALNRGEGTRKLAETRYTCLPEVLAAQGYRTVFLQGCYADFAGTDRFMLGHGMAEVHGQAAVIRRFPEAATWGWGVPDDTLVAYAKEQIGRLEALRAHDNRPYLLVMITTDTHQPGIPGDLCPLDEAEQASLATLLPANDPVVERMLRSYRCADRALGALGTFLLSPARREETLWVLTADHVQLDLPHVRRMLGKTDYDGNYGRLPLLIHDPQHHLPKRIDVLAGTTDLAPTVLHLLDVVTYPNTMGGRSVFGRRSSQPLIVGRIGQLDLYFETPTMRKSWTFPKARQLCSAGLDPLAKAKQPLTLCQLLAWADWQDALWEAGQLLPPRPGSPPGAG